MLYGSGVLAAIGSSQVKGTWNLTFNPDGEISLSNPTGSYTNFFMPSDSVALFSGSAYAYFGVQPNQLASIGQAVTFGQIQISGVASPINDPFQDGILDGATWEIAAQDPSGIATVAGDALCWVNWTLPDTGFQLQVTDDIGFHAWSGLSASKSQIGDFRRVVIRQSAVPASATGNYFFQLLRTP
jgi:hypothetical protein